jgi:hypothetical protein
MQSQIVSDPAIGLAVVCGQHDPRPDHVAVRDPGRVGADGEDGSLGGGQHDHEP